MELKFWKNVHTTLCVICHVSCVTCHLSHVTCHVSHVTCHKIFVVQNFLLLFIYIIFFTLKQIRQSGRASWWRVCYPRGLSSFRCIRHLTLTQTHAHTHTHTHTHNKINNLKAQAHKHTQKTKTQILPLQSTEFWNMTGFEDLCGWAIQEELSCLLSYFCPLQKL